MILVPEIALTPQMVMWFRARFGAVAAVLHSRLSAGERFDEWRRIRRGDARVVIGARSAVFAPCGNLGLIVVDEEHESTYISDRHPRYDAREVAIRRCENEHATLLLASATPSILSFARARRGDYVLLEMPSRVGNRPMPQVTLVDMRKEMENGNRSVFSGQLVAALKNCVARGEQAMLLMNRRGYNNYVSCRSCGKSIKCPNCSVTLTYHAKSMHKLPDAQGEEYEKAEERAGISSAISAATGAPFPKNAPNAERITSSSWDAVRRKPRTTSRQCSRTSEYCAWTTILRRRNSPMRKFSTNSDADRQTCFSELKW